MKKFKISILLVVFLAMAPSISQSDNKIKKPNVSGQFYSADPKKLSNDVEQFLSQASVSPSDDHIEMMIAPHAGYAYSGSVAAYSFKAVSKKKYKTIVILAPSHFYNFDGISIWPEGSFETPLGAADVDNQFAQKLISQDDKFYFDEQAFQKEHSLEVEIPFLQKTFHDFKIVPVVFGNPRYETLEKFAAKLKEVVGSRNDVLIVVSTDMSHYHNDEFARDMDAKTITAVKNLQPVELYKQCYLRTLELCGFIPVTTALIYAKAKGLDNVQILRYGNSGDVTGDRTSVVGYFSAVFSRSGNKKEIEKSLAGTVLTDGQRKQLIEIAKKTIEEYVNNRKILSVTNTDLRLSEEEGAFVTLHEAGRLRGCIGNIIGRGPLYLTVRDMAIAAASADPRFKAVTSEELKNIDLEISVLTKPRTIKSIDEIILGTHGVIVSQDGRQGVFLPQVATETGWSKEEFLSQLCSQKAGLDRDAWKDPKTRIDIFSAQVFSK